jgi:RNA polymerase sigma factor (sigma-70 family)
MASPNHTAWVMEVVGIYEARLVRYAADMVGPSLAADVVQDTFLRLCDQERARVESHLAAWLFTVCRNRALELRRKLRRVGPLEPERAGPDHPHGPDVAVLHREALQRVRAAVSDLPERERELVRLKFDGELSYKEIAEVTGLSVSNVGFILHTAVQRMREAMEHGEEPTREASARRLR